MVEKTMSGLAERRRLRFTGLTATETTECGEETRQSCPIAIPLSLHPIARTKSLLPGPSIIMRMTAIRKALPDVE